MRKSVFLRQVARSLALTQTHVHTVRFEELLTRADLHESLSAVSIRAVRVDAQVLTTLQAFLAPGGEILRFTTAQSDGPTAGAADGPVRRPRTPAREPQPPGRAAEGARSVAARPTFHVKHPQLTRGFELTPCAFMGNLAAAPRLVFGQIPE